MVEAAIRALRTLTSSDIAEVKALKAPPDGVILTFEAVCTLLGI